MQQSQLPSWQTAPYRAAMPYIDQGADAVREFLNKLGPDVGDRLYGLMGGVAELSPAQDIVGALQSSGETMKGLMIGDMPQAALGAGNTVGNLAMLALPGSLAGTRGLMKQAFHGDAPLSQGMEHGAVPQMPAKVDPGPYAAPSTYGEGPGAIEPGYAEGRALKAEEMVASGKQQGLMNEPDLPPQDLSMYGAPAGSDPRYLGAGPDRSGFTHVRYRPTGGASSKVTDAIEGFRQNHNGVKDRLLADIRAGEELGGNDWYNSEELRDWFVAELGEKRGDKEWREFIDLLAATSTGNKVDSNIGVAAFYRMLGDNAEDFGKMERWRPGKDPKILLEGYGHKMQKGQAKNVAEIRAGNWEGLPEPGVLASKGAGAENMKPKGYRGSLFGNKTNIAADVHFTRYMGMAANKPEWLATNPEVSQKTIDALRKTHGSAIDKYIKVVKKKGDKPKIHLQARKSVEDGVATMDDYAKEATVWQQMPNDNEYAAFEDYINELGEELGMTAAQVQANLWMGAAKRTGVADSSQGTLMELIRARATKRGAEEGKSMEEILQRFIRERGLLTAPAAGVLGAGAVGGGLMQPERDGA